MSTQDIVIRQAIEDLKKEAVWIGEDGNAACSATTELGALRKFKRLMRECVGDLEAREMKVEDVSVGWLFPVTPEMRAEEDAPVWYEECEWYVSLAEESPHQVFIYSV